MLVALMLWAILACFTMWWLLQHWLNNRKCANVPTIPGAVPLLGHAHKFLGDSKRMYDSIIEFSKHTNNNGGIIRIWWGFTRYFSMYDSIIEFSKHTNNNGGIIRIWWGFTRYFIVTDPKISQTLMNLCLKKNYFTSFPASWVGQGLVTADTPIWKVHRKLINPTFNQQVLEGYLHIFNKQARVLVKTLESKVGIGQFDVSGILISNSLETVCQTVMGLPINGQSRVVHDEYADAVDKMMQVLVFRVLRLWMHFDFLYNQSAMKKQEDDAVKILKSTSFNIMQKRKTLLNEASNVDFEKKESKFKTFLDLLLELNAKGVLTENEVREEVDTMIVTAYDTTATSLLYQLITIGSHSMMQEKIYQELQEVLSDSDSDVTKKDLIKLVYLDAFIKEAMRFYPIVDAIIRFVERDIKFDDFTIPAGSNFALMIHGILRHKCWGDVDTFRPERWLDPASLHAGAYASFGLGRRNCIGQTYAMMSIKTSLVHLLRRYKFSGDRFKLKHKFEVMTKPVSGHFISLEYR